MFDWKWRIEIILALLAMGLGVLAGIQTIIGYACLAISGALSIHLAYDFWQKRRRQQQMQGRGSNRSVTDQRLVEEERRVISTGKIDYKRLNKITGGELNFILIIADKVYKNHGHYDLEGLFQDCIEGKPLVDGRCYECGRPRNESLWRRVKKSER